MTTTDRTGADTATFEAEMQRLDRLEVADEDTVERVARALWNASNPMRTDTFASEQLDRLWKADEVAPLRDDYRRLARAAIATLKPAPGTDSSGQAVQRVLDLADRWEADAKRADDAEPATRDDLSRMIAASRWSRQHAADLRAAVAEDEPHTCPYADEHPMMLACGSCDYLSRSVRGLIAEELHSLAGVVNTAVFPDEQAPGMRRALVALLTARADELTEDDAEQQT